MNVYALHTAHDTEIEAIQEDNRSREVLDRQLSATIPLYATLERAQSQAVCDLHGEMVQWIGAADEDEVTDNVEDLPAPMLIWRNPSEGYWETSFEHDGVVYRFAIHKQEVQE